MAIGIEGAGQGIIDPFVTFYNALISNLPGILGAIAIIIIGYFVAIILGYTVGKIIERIKIDKWLEEAGRADSLGGMHISTVGAKLVKWWVFVTFLVPAANVIQLSNLSTLLIKLAEWIPHLIAGIVIMIAGLIAADFLADSAAHAKKLKGIKVVSSVIRVLVIIFFADIALREIGINIILAEQTILIIIGGIVLAISLAVGIGFGHGLKKQSDSILKDIRKKLK